jgi:hypothetical protein
MGREKPARERYIGDILADRMSARIEAAGRPVEVKALSARGLASNVPARCAGFRLR